MLAPRRSCDVVVTLPEVAVVRLDPSAAEWPVQVDQLRALSGAPDNPRLFPAHFLKAAFYKLGGPPLPAAWRARHPDRLRIESQLLGVLPEYRERQIGFGLKRLQADLARREGISLVNWTVDPLQFANARFNFSRLGAVAFDFYPSFYEFRNQLNRVPASRLGITWLVGSARVRAALAARESPLPELADDPTLPRVPLGQRAWRALTEADRVAIEVPSNWTGLQHT